MLFPKDAGEGLPLADIVETTLRMSKVGLIDIVEQARLGDGVNLLVVVDQFEELFRYRQLGVAGATTITASAKMPPLSSTCSLKPSSRRPVRSSSS